MDANVLEQPMKKKRTQKARATPASKKSVPKAIAPVESLLSQIQLMDIRMLTTNASIDVPQLVKNKKMPEHVTQQVEIKGKKGSDLLQIVVGVSISGRMNDDATETPVLRVEAQYMASFKVQKGVSVTDDVLNAVSVIGAMAIFPYWRELTQSTTGRMGLPPLVLPLLRVGDIVNQTGTE